MADSITAMGSSPVYFPLVPNWAFEPKISFNISRNYIDYPASAQFLQSVTPIVPKEFTLAFMVNNKTDEYELLEFLHEIKGRSYRFWIEYPVNSFVVKETSSSGSTSVKCMDNGFEKIAQGNERIFIVMKTGDLVVRKVTEATYDSTLDVLTLVFDSPLDRDLETDNYFIFGRFLLCRLASDSIAQEMVTNDISKFSMKFIELATEYDEEEAS